MSSLVAIKLIDNKELGVVLFAYNIIVFLIPFSGLGLQQGFLRFGALLKSEEEKRNLFFEVLKKGIKGTVFFILSIIVVTNFISFKYEHTNTYIVILSFLLIPSYILELFKIFFRINHDNKMFSKIEILNSILLFILIFAFSYFFQENGYITALVISPVVTILFTVPKFNFKISKNAKTISTSFWKYGFFATLSNVVTQLLFTIDIIIIGFLLSNSEMVTFYKYITLIPFSLLFIPRIFMSTDFVAFTENIHDKAYIKKYIKNYVQLFSLIAIVILPLLALLGKLILNLFDKQLSSFLTAYYILLIGVAGALILRGLFGNLLSSIGKAHVNFYVGSGALLINIVGNFYLIPKYGITGAAITSALIMWLTSLTTYFIFKLYYSKF